MDGVTALCPFCHDGYLRDGSECWGCAGRGVVEVQDDDLSAGAVPATAEDGGTGTPAVAAEPSTT